MTCWSAHRAIITLCPHLKSVAKNVMGVSWGAEGWGALIFTCD